MTPLERVAEWADDVPVDLQITRSQSLDRPEFDVDAFLQRHGLVVRRRAAWQNGEKIELESCPINPEHIGGCSVVTRSAGVLGFKCHHDSCSGIGWKELRARLEPEYRFAQKSAAVTSNMSIAPIVSRALDLGSAAILDESGTIDHDDESLPEFPEHAWRGVFADYREAMVGATEASDVAHFASLWVALATTAGRRVSMYAGERLYPNVYLNFFGRTGDKKTTAMRRGLCLIPSTVKITRNVGSTEGLAEKLKPEGDGDAVALLYWEEIASILVRGQWKGSSILEFLTEAFDCPPTWGLDYRRNPIAIVNPTPSIIAGTTPEWFWKNARIDSFYGGFGNRFLYLTGNRKEPIPNPHEPNEALIERVRTHFESLAAMPDRTAKFDSVAEKLWEGYYIQSENQRPYGLLAAATRRIHVYIRKLAMLFAALESTLPYINADQLRAAIAVGKYATHCASLLIDQRSASQSYQGEIEQRVLDWIRRNGPRKKRYVQQTLSKICGSCEMFNKVISSLERAGHIAIQEGSVYYLG